MFQITNGGICTRHNASFIMNRPRGFDRYVLLITRTEAHFHFPDACHSVPSHQAIFIAPHTPYSYHNPNGAYSDDWLHFTCADEDISVLDSSAFHHPFPVNNPPMIMSCLQQLLYENNYAPKELRTKHIDSIFRILVDHLMYDFHNAPVAPYSPYLYPLQKLRLDMQAAPQNAGNAKEAASTIGISLSYFQHLYSQFFHISYQKDLIRMKLSYAKELLSTTDMSVEDVAFACGYTNPVHFYRQFQTFAGITPGKYRENFFY